MCVRSCREAAQEKLPIELQEPSNRSHTAASSAGPSASPIADSATSDNITPPPSKAEMKVGEGFQRSEWCKKHGRDAYGGSIGDDEDEFHNGKVKKSRRGKRKPL